MYSPPAQPGNCGEVPCSGIIKEIFILESKEYEYRKDKVCIKKPSPRVRSAALKSKASAYNYGG